MPRLQRGAFVVKVQRSISNFETPAESILIYDEQREHVVLQRPCRGLLAKFFPSEYTIYVQAMMSSRNRMVLGKRVPRQEW